MKAPAFWNKMAARYQAYSQRERRIIALAAILGPALVLYSLLLDPQLKRQRGLKTALVSSQQQLADVRTQVAALENQLRQDPDAEPKAQLEQLRQALGGANNRLQKLEESLVLPSQMNVTLERILARHPNLQLLSLKTLSPESVLPMPKAESKEPGNEVPTPRAYDLYRHGIELHLEGSYSDLYAYLTQLEREQKRLLWGRLQFEVKKHPTASMTLRVYTLSSDKAWLSI